MARAEELRARYEAELAVVELEEELVTLKATDADVDALRDCKRRLREARYTHRLEREGASVASPAVIEVSTNVTSLEG